MGSGAIWHPNQRLDGMPVLRLRHTGAGIGRSGAPAASSRRSSSSECALTETSGILKLLINSYLFLILLIESLMISFNPILFSNSTYEYQPETPMSIIPNRYV